ncbi:unnamed protein product [Caenorhabditis bovis]|uniref:Major facilitator superfamily (MFS) profile domain-containing protein n=1 Tax=Caenorhabditis bovis TaxID=2654633 RepID=A0A8S1FEK9_9PELO|nr:unnamed protein product [Caenorhabditis bovis]
MAKLGISLNLLYIITIYSVLGLYLQIQNLIFPTVPQCLEAMHNHTLKYHYGIEPTKQLVSFMNSSMMLGSGIVLLISIFTILPIAETKGRKFVCVYLRFFVGFFTNFLMLVASIIQASELYMIGEIFATVMVPIVYVTFVYIGECAPDAKRGFASTSLAVCGVVAHLLMYSTSSPSLLGAPDTWFVYPFVCFLGSIALFVTTVGLPESPKWLVRVGNNETARQAIRFYHGTDCDIDEVLVSMIREKNLTRANQLTLRQIWNDDTLREALKLIIVFQIYNSTSPIVVERSYTILLQTSLGLTIQEALNLNLLIVIAMFPARFIAPLLIDKIGRRALLFFAALIMYFKLFVMLVAQTLAFFFGGSLLTKLLVYLSESLSEIYASIMTIAIAALLISELFPPSARTAVFKLYMIAGIVSTAPLTLIFPIINVVFPPAFYIPIIVIQPIIIIYLYRYLPETKAKPIADIVSDFDNAVSSRASSICMENTPLLRKRAMTLQASIYDSFL